MGNKKLLIIDPCMKTPEVDAYNRLSAQVAEFARHPSFAFDGVQFLLPQMTNTRLAELAQKYNLGAVVSLGSYANLTDSHPWALQLAADLQEYVLGQRIPLFGICFTHQLLAHDSGSRVDFLRLQKKVPRGAYHEFRVSTVVHPYLKLLLSGLTSSDYFSENLRDLNFRDVVQSTRFWTAQQWLTVFAQNAAEGAEVLTPQERRVRNFVSTFTQNTYITHARHEQEVYNLPGKDWFCAATSPQCGLDSLVHAHCPAFTFQTHPETLHPSRDGERMLSNFLYLSHLLAGE